MALRMIDLRAAAIFIASFEGFVGHVYDDGVGVETIGYGETRRDIIERYRSSGISEPTAFDLLQQRVQEFADAVERCITNRAALTPIRHAALTSFAYNVGIGGFRDSTVCARFNSGDIAGVPEAMSWWNKGGGRVLEGLSRRRAAEGALLQKDGSSFPGARTYGTGPAHGTTRGVLQEGDRGEKVQEAQRCLVDRGVPLSVDGVFGPRTADAVRSLQRRHALVADGVLGPATWQMLLSGVPIPAHDGLDVPPWPGRVLTQGIDGEDVHRMQGRLAQRGWGILIDGRFGPKTDAVVRSYQQEKALPVDGLVGRHTWLSLWIDPVT